MTAGQLVQAGADWYFDTTAPLGPVLDVEVQQDADGMAMRGWMAGQGSEAGTPMATAYDPTFVDAGWPLLEMKDSSGAELADTLDGQAAALVAAHARPVEVWKLTVRAEAALDVLEGDYARVVVRDDDYLPDGEHRVRVQKISASGDTVTLDMYPLLAVV